ncbi:hypothetical protein HK102_003646 [Quaeritorhiza haematococci]|nr:hypothetical protein HK102_003646 [Quaeritorhiza haematococci]
MSTITCSVCFKTFASLRGLTHHYNSIHPNAVKTCQAARYLQNKAGNSELVTVLKEEPEDDALTKGQDRDIDTMDVDQDEPLLESLRRSASQVTTSNAVSEGIRFEDAEFFTELDEIAERLEADAEEYDGAEEEDETGEGQDDEQDGRQDDTLIQSTLQKHERMGDGIQQQPRQWLVWN